MVSPCFNEQEALPQMVPRLAKKLDELEGSGDIAPGSTVLLVDDGSTDDTWPAIRALSQAFPRVQGMRLSRNRGQQNALYAGLMETRGRCDAVITIDCDGQDDIDVAGEMVTRYRDGYDVVYGVRSDRDSDSAFKRTTAQAFCKLLGWLGAEVVYNHADYRLLSARVVEGLAGFREVNLYLRGLVPLVGFTSCEVFYVRAPRVAGSTHYSLGKMLSLALDGITSLSIKPIRLIMALGACISAISFIGIVWAVVTALGGHAVSGWASVICVILLLGGVQLISIGVIGEYVGKTYLEAKARPRYIVAERTQEPAGGKSKSAAALGGGVPPAPDGHTDAPGPREEGSSAG